MREDANEKLKEKANQIAKRKNAIIHKPRKISGQNERSTDNEKDNPHNNAMLYDLSNVGTPDYGRSVRDAVCALR